MARRLVKLLAGPWAAPLIVRVLRLTRRHAGLALIYHTIDQRQGDPSRELVPPLASERFRRQLRHLKRHYHVVAPEQFMHAVRTRRRGERFPVCLTFDDDAPQHVAHALPILQELGLPAMFFLCGSFIGEEMDFWWTRLQRAVDRGVSASKLADLVPASETTRSTGQQHDIHSVAGAVSMLRPAERESIDVGLTELAGDDDPADLLRVEGVAELVQAGFTVGFHTRHHHALTVLDDSELRRALTEGRADLEQLVGRRIDAIAYPYGVVDRRVADAARRADFRLGFSCAPTATTPSSDPLLLGRFEPRAGPLGEFALGVVRPILKPPLLSELPHPADTRPIRSALRRIVPPGRRHALMRRYRRLTAWPPVGFVRFGSLRRGTPISRNFGQDRGRAIDRYYIEDFLRRHSGAPGYVQGTIRGHVLEIGEALYSRQFARAGDIERLDILDVSAENPNATLISDLTNGSNLLSDAFDCVICTQVLIVIYDIRAVVRTLHRILKPGGALLVTLPGISQICRPDMDEWGDYWRFTTLSARRLFEEVFDPAEVTVEAYGNVLSATAFLYGLAAEDLRRRELDLRDPDYEVTIGLKAVKRSANTEPRPANTEP